ncbi:hypothetical protein GBAR_LOCUS17909, partial [Geodia barretti]
MLSLLDVVLSIPYNLFSAFTVTRYLVSGIRPVSFITVSCAIAFTPSMFGPPP